MADVVRANGYRLGGVASDKLRVTSEFTHMLVVKMALHDGP